METEHHREKEPEFSYIYVIKNYRYEVREGKGNFHLIPEQSEHMSNKHVMLVSCNPFRKLAILKIKYGL